uniref:Uncharacterized protein n=1 Tax=Chromera velia CCMP2878 TaxID=1169474 RepID=A0A0G4I6B5_9ALVE|eukprot:Cvel_11366.t1-p1 / transcript=Cvel_11366.t1 / gene=Cvel_11366 / organism=Chromera_velia_CCMP2878 / gene_product=Germination-specific cysteine protease 1, putative / transcript_product=Germination-specific cysteine protease 1, putative / location=Cvel_scaffold712:46848-49504(+) / protein_length=396 / sequence_SO=supercontig / SO=protein_coding / is_pseudo=false
MSEHYVSFTTGEQSVQGTRRFRKFNRTAIALTILPAIALASLVGVFTYIYATRTSAGPVEKFQGVQLWSDGFMAQSFNEFRLKYNRAYLDTEEEGKRFEIFKKNMAYITAHNNANSDFKLAVNQFADMTPAEYRKKFTGFKPLPGRLGTNPNHKLDKVNVSDLPTSINWIDKGCVTGVKDQGQCGSCWAFSATGALEGVHCRNTGKLVSLSEQQLVDCSGPEGNLGCSGGLMDAAFEYVDKHGLCSEKDYPYKGINDDCHASECTPVIKGFKGFYDVPTESESALMGAVASHGPVAVAIEADEMAFQFYSSGVFTSRCGTNLDHGVLVVGYGTEKGLNFWLVKNSWGASWGDKGYIKMVRNSSKASVGSGGECGILMQPSYPTEEGEEPPEEAKEI